MWLGVLWIVFILNFLFMSKNHLVSQDALEGIVCKVDDSLVAISGFVKNLIKRRKEIEIIDEDVEIKTIDDVEDVILLRGILEELVVMRGLVDELVD